MNRRLPGGFAPRLMLLPDTRDEAGDSCPALLTGHSTVVSAAIPDAFATRRAREGAPC